MRIRRIYNAYYANLILARGARKSLRIPGAAELLERNSIYGISSVVVGCKNNQKRDLSGIYQRLGKQITDRHGPREPRKKLRRVVREL